MAHAWKACIPKGIEGSTPSLSAFARRSFSEGGSRFVVEFEFLSMSYFIIIRGPLCSGKTTISKQLSKLLGAEHISIDKVLDENKLDKVGPDANGIPVENFIKANEIVLPTAKEKLAKGQVVIFDACFYYKEPIEHLIKSLSYPHYEFTLKAPVEVCIARDSIRNLIYGEDAARAVHSMVSRFDYGQNIDVSGDLDSGIKQILSFLPKQI